MCPHRRHVPAPSSKPVRHAGTLCRPSPCPRPMSQVRVAASSGGFPDPAIVFRRGVNWCSGEHVDGPPLPRKSCDQGEDEYSPRSNTCVHSHAKNELLFRCGASTGHPKSWAPGFGMLTQVCQSKLLWLFSVLLLLFKLHYFQGDRYEFLRVRIPCASACWSSRS